MDYSLNKTPCRTAAPSGPQGLTHARRVGLVSEKDSAGRAKKHALPLVDTRPSG
jgi:hypothetical protein